MPPIFKALATIVAWILFISGCLATLMIVVALIVQGGAYCLLAAWAMSIACLTLSVVVMYFRKLLR
jgi:hypothetical protein